MENEIMNTNAIDAVEMNTPVVAQDTPVSSSGINLKTAGLAGLAAVVVGAVAYYGYKKYKDHKAAATETETAEESK